MIKIKRILLVILSGMSGLFLLISAPLLYFELIGSSFSQCSSTQAPVTLKRLPYSGKNYESYCAICMLALSSYGPPPMIETIKEAYQHLASTHPNTQFLYGFMGFPWTDRQNGHFADFMVPLESFAPLDAKISNRFGYGLEFNAEGKSGEEQIDFNALASHLRALQDAAKRHNGTIERVLLAPSFQPLLFKQRHGKDLKDSLTFETSQDNHEKNSFYRVFFLFPCK